MSGPGASDQPLGPAVPEWVAPPFPVPVGLAGRWVRLEPLERGPVEDLYAAVCGPGRERLWTYLSEDMPRSAAAFAGYVERRLVLPATTTLCLVPRFPRDAGRGGLVSLMRVDRPNGALEVGAIVLGPACQRTTAATEAMSLLAQHVFDLGYRRLEWKCDSLNAPSRAAALRLGFRYEGTSRNAVVTKGRSRDTAWFAMTDDDWRLLSPVHQRWLSPAGHEDPVTGDGQRWSLSQATADALAVTTGRPCAETAVSEDGMPSGRGRGSQSRRIR